MNDDKEPPVVDLHPSAWDDDWQPPIGNQLHNGEKAHIWQEFKRDQHMIRGDNESVIGRGWPIFAFVLLVIAVQSYFSISGSPAWLLAIKNVF